MHLRSTAALTNETIEDIGRGLRLWLIGELSRWVLIGALVTTAVWLIGLPSPLALGVIAGLAEFVPYLGPVVASVPAILVATTKGRTPPARGRRQHFSEIASPATNG